MTHRSSHLGRWMAAVGLLTFVAAVLGTPARATYGAQTSGDEPYYLISAISLGADGDLDISDQLASQAYRPFHETGLNPQTAPLDSTGREVSPHDPLLSILLAGPMAAGGWVVAKVVLAAVAALTASITVWLIVRRLGVPAPVAGAVSTAGFTGIPLAAYGTQVYPEMPAALTLVIGLAGVTAPQLDRQPLGPVAVTLGALVALPWWSVKYVPVAAVVGLALLWRLRHQPRTTLSVVGLATIAGAGYLVAHQAIYGGWTVYAAGDHFVETGEFSVVGTQVDLLGRARRLGGLIVDRQFGLAAWSPLWFLLPVAVGRSLGDRSATGTLLLGLVAVGWMNATFVALTMHGWWMPGRQVVVVLPAALALLAAWASESARRLGAVVALGLIGLSNWVWLAVEAATGRRTLIVDFAETAAPAYRLVAGTLPDGIRSGPADAALLTAWSVGLFTFCVVGWSGGRKDQQASCQVSNNSP